MSHAATTWQSSEARKALVLSGPCQPMPITPRLMRLFAEVAGLCAANAGRTAGKIAADPATFRKLRRLIGERATPETNSSDMFYLNTTFHKCGATCHPAWP